MGSALGLLCGGMIILFVFVGYFLISPFGTSRSTRNRIAFGNTFMMIIFITVILASVIVYMAR